MKLELTAVFRKVPEGYLGFVEELPGANTQGETLEVARRNLGGSCPYGPGGQSPTSPRRARGTGSDPRAPSDFRVV